MNTSIRVALVDDHALFRDSVARFLSQEPDIVVAGVCGTLEEAKKLLALSRIDLVLLDYDLGGELGTELLDGIRVDYPHSRVLIVTGGMSVSVIRRAIQSGASGLFLKHGDPSQLLKAVRQIAQGGTWWDRATVKAVAESTAEPAAFTARQRRILELLLNGLSNKEMAVELKVSEAAVKASLQELFQKTGVRTRSQLVRVALETAAVQP